MKEHGVGFQRLRGFVRFSASGANQRLRFFVFGDEMTFKVGPAVAYLTSYAIVANFAFVANFVDLGEFR